MKQPEVLQRAFSCSWGVLRGCTPNKRRKLALETHHGVQARLRVSRGGIASQLLQVEEELVSSGNLDM